MAEKKPLANVPLWKKLVALFVCLLIIGIIIFLIIQNNTKPNIEPVNAAVPDSIAFDNYEAKQKIFSDNPVEDSFLSAIKDFSYKSAPQIFSDNCENINYSPLSLYYALSIAATGAGGETANEILTLLGESDKNNLSAQCGNLYRQLYTDNEIGKLKIANSLWLKNSLTWKSDFINNAASNFYASSFSVNFSDSQTGKDMGKWVAENTNSALTPEINVTPQQIMSIINTVYFCDQWTNEFDEEKTAQDVFNLADTSTVNCDFMNSNGSGEFTKGTGFTRAELGLKNGGQMVFILPDEGVSPMELLSNADKAKEAFEGGESAYGKIVWQIPKFSFDSKLDIAEKLKKLGVTSAFNETADFSEITDGQAFISNISQETHIAIDEKGVEAAAFTKIDYMGAGLPEDKAEMLLNRPFIYGIQSQDGTLLFIGICENPTVQ